MTQQCGLDLISKLRSDAALQWKPPTKVKEGPGRPQIYGERFNPRQIDPENRTSTQVQENIRTEVYQMNLQHKKFPEGLNVVCVLKTNVKTKQQ